MTYQAGMWAYLTLQEYGGLVRIIVDHPYIENYYIVEGYIFPGSRWRNSISSRHLRPAVPTSQEISAWSLEKMRQ